MTTISIQPANQEKSAIELCLIKVDCLKYAGSSSSLTGNVVGSAKEPSADKETSVDNKLSSGKESSSGTE